MKTKEKVNYQIKKECIKRLDEVYSVIMTFGREWDAMNGNYAVDEGNSELPKYLKKIDDLQNYLEEIL